MNIFEFISKNSSIIGAIVGISSIIMAILLPTKAKNRMETLSELIMDDLRTRVVMNIGMILEALLICLTVYNIDNYFFEKTEASFYISCAASFFFIITPILLDFRNFFIHRFTIGLYFLLSFFNMFYLGMSISNVNRSLGFVLLSIVSINLLLVILLFKKYSKSWIFEVSYSLLTITFLVTASLPVILLR